MKNLSTVLPKQQQELKPPAPSALRIPQAAPPATPTPRAPTPPLGLPSGHLRSAELPYVESPSTRCLRFLVPKTIPLMVFATGDLSIGYVDPMGSIVRIVGPLLRMDIK